MFAPPPAVSSRVFARLPEEFRRPARTSELADQHPGHRPTHSILEGPSFDLDGNLWCVDIPFGRVFRIDPKGNFTQVGDYEGEPNGLKIHRDGRIFITDFKHGVVVLDPDTGKVKPFFDRYRLEHIKAPNDLVFAANGDLWFTDQGLTGHHDPTGRLFRIRADGRADLVVDRIPSPNGVVMHPGEETVYVAVTRANAIWRVPLMRDGSAAKVGTFIQMSGGMGPDGIAMDAAGNLAVAHVGFGAVWLFGPRGEPVLRIDSCKGHMTTNVAFHGGGEKKLYITESETGCILEAEVPNPGRPMFSHM